jgi:NUDIX domain
VVLCWKLTVSALHYHPKIETRHRNLPARNSTTMTLHVAETIITPVMTPPGSEHPVLSRLPNFLCDQTSVEVFPDNGLTLVEFFREESFCSNGSTAEKNMSLSTPQPPSDVSAVVRQSLEPIVVSQQERERISRVANTKAIEEILCSREGRDNQRWAIDPANTDRRIRLVAGCIPILPNGHILLISSRTAEKRGSTGFLSLPKGGWELDERIEEGAIRETYEEAGVLGLLGQPLESFCIMSSKKNASSKKRGDEEQFQSNIPVIIGKDDFKRIGEPLIAGTSTDVSFVSETDDIDAASEAINIDATIQVDNCLNFNRSDVCNWKNFIQVNDSPSSSPFGVGVSHTHSCHTFFPLYVQRISDDWPEKMRRRYVLSIDGTSSSLSMMIQPSAEHAYVYDHTDFVLYSFC